MPILPPETDVYPADLLDEPSWNPEAAPQAWWGLYTRARREKELARKLKAMGISFYCPMIAQRTTTPKGRVHVSQVPMFQSYVFLCGDDDARREALTTNCISRCLPVSDVALLKKDLRQIQQLIESGAAITPENKIAAGARVRICSGAMTGVEGIVLKRHGQERLVVSVSFLQQGASVLLDECQLEQLDP